MALPYWHHWHNANGIPAPELMEPHQEIHQAVCNAMLNPASHRQHHDPATKQLIEDFEYPVVEPAQIRDTQRHQQEYRKTVSRMSKAGVQIPEQRMYICRCPPPYPLIPGRAVPREYEQYFQHRAVVEPTQEVFDSMPKVETSKDCTKVGYWSIVVPKMTAEFMAKVATALKLVANEQPLTNVFIDSPDVSIRFDLRERHKTRLRLQIEARHPAMPRDAIPWSTQDPDALIVDHKEYGKALNIQKINEQINKFKAQILRTIACSGLRIHVKASRNDLLMSYNSKDDELRARGLLCEMIGWDEYKKYLKRGFIVVKGKSGMLYKIAGGHSMMYVYQRKDETGNWYYRESICLQFKDHNLPFTDAVIMRMLFVESDEFGMRKMANVRQNIWHDSIQDAARQHRRMERVG